MGQAELGIKGMYLSKGCLITWQNLTDNRVINLSSQWLVSTPCVGVCARLCASVCVREHGCVSVCVCVHVCVCVEQLIKMCNRFSDPDMPLE